MRASQPDDDVTPVDARAEHPGDVEIVIIVHVVRSGGIAGLKREWTAEPQPTEAPRWIGLIDECPWDAAAPDPSPSGADRFQWRISARYADEPPRRAALSDGELRGPWRELVDQVRAFGAPERERPGR